MTTDSWRGLTCPTSIIAAKHNKDPDYWSSGSSVIDMIKSKPGEPLTAKYVMKQIEIVMNKSQKQGGKLNVKLKDNCITRNFL